MTEIERVQADEIVARTELLRAQASVERVRASSMAIEVFEEAKAAGLGVKALGKWLETFSVSD